MKMSRELRQLLADLSAKSVLAQAIINKEGATKEEISASTSEINVLKSKIEAQKAIDEGRNFDSSGVEVAELALKPLEKKVSNHQKAFINVLLRRETREDIEILNALTESTPADGGLLVPSDIQTAINTYKRTLSDLKDLVNVVPVSNASGSRVYEKIATMTAFANITDDTADIADAGSPQFETILYAIKKYAGYIPVPNDLLTDSDANVAAYLATWIGRKSVVTGNSLILAILNAMTKVVFANYKAIKKALNITLDPAIAIGAVIVTNQDGFQYLDALEDTTGKPLLQIDVTNPTQKLLFGKQLIVVGNNVLLTTGTTTKLAPCIVGNLKEAIMFFENTGYQIASTNVGGTAFRKDRTEFRVIEREDVKAVDVAAVVFGTIDVTAVLA